jgi:hypothetical protein
MRRGHEPHHKMGVNTGVSEGYAVSAPLVTRRVSLATKPVISHTREKDREALTTSGIYPTFQ